MACKPAASQAGPGHPSPSPAGNPGLPKNHDDISYGLMWTSACGKKYPKGGPNLPQISTEGKPNLRSSLRPSRRHLARWPRRPRALPPRAVAREAAGNPLPRRKGTAIAVAARPGELRPCWTATSRGSSPSPLRRPRDRASAPCTTRCDAPLCEPRFRLVRAHSRDGKGPKGRAPYGGRITFPPPARADPATHPLSLNKRGSKPLRSSAAPQPRLLLSTFPQSLVHERSARPGPKDLPGPARWDRSSFLR
jgi:hypothetical protein